MTKTTPELSPPANFLTTPAGGRLAPYVSFNMQQTHSYSGSSVEYCFKPGILWSRSRDLTAKSPRPSKIEASTSNVLHVVLASLVVYPEDVVECESFLPIHRLQVETNRVEALVAQGKYVVVSYETIRL
ncbi:hypothetical protein AVEN_29775-1 [Araneus ventricosus]|uniref:Uncharacterized protein n=1 Tax=Araneus ventricosus TaxID=182803 RepID=A0A4Y2E810_ARAVE|nr:hypothetical protein AVEN_29775-1 [Araneus ventricosus]